MKLETLNNRPANLPSAERPNLRLATTNTLTLSLGCNPPTAVELHKHTFNTRFRNRALVTEMIRPIRRGTPP